jgi:hypothetical protein
MSAVGSLRALPRNRSSPSAPTSPMKPAMNSNHVWSYYVHVIILSFRKYVDLDLIEGKF